MITEQANILATAEAARRFVLAGKATVTLRSQRTGAHFTYKVEAAKDQTSTRFVSLLTNGDTYRYLGILSAMGQGFVFRTTKKSCLPATSPAAAGFEVFFRNLWLHERIAPGLDVMHEGKCGRCNRALTHPESLESGFGPECIGRIDA